MPELDDYILANRDQYTREAMTEQLIAAGYDRAAIDDAWRRSEDKRAGTAPVGWRPSWKVLIALTAIGAVGAFFVWSIPAPGLGPPFAPIAAVAYLIAAGVVVAIGKGISEAVDSGRSISVAVILAVIGALLAWIAFANMLPVLGALSIIGFALAAGAFLLLRGHSRQLGALGAVIPLVFLLIVTGTCYAPLFSIRPSTP